MIGQARILGNAYVGFFGTIKGERIDHESYPTREAAQVMVAEIERGGRKALIYKTASLDAIGLPVGWEATA